MRGPVWLVAWLLAGAVSSAGELRFEEVSQPWGVDFRHHHGGTGDFFMVETMGSGVAIFDYDGDGDEDLFWVDSGGLPGLGGSLPGSKLLRNDGDRSFRDVTASARLVSRAYGMGATAGDIDGDGDLDLYVTAFGANELWRNEGDGTFSERGGPAGVDDGRWTTSAAFADADGDGDLDLYAANYVDFSYDNNPTCGLQSRNLRSYCHPDVYNGAHDRFYRNLGDGTFRDETTAAGFGQADGKGLGVLFEDLDGDRRPDVYVANDMTANHFYRNAATGFADVAVLAGIAFNEHGEAEAGMGVEAGDLDGDGYPEIMLTHLDRQTNALYSGGSAAFFSDRRYLMQLAEPSFYRVGFGVVFADFDQDGRLDIAVANGHIVHNIDAWDRGTTFKQRNQAFHQVVRDGAAVFEEVSDAGLDVVRASRGMAAGDLDGDGDIDLAVSNSDDRCEVYENVTAGGGWLRIDVLAAAGQPAVGAEIRLGDGQRRQLRTATSYLSQGTAAAHFGLGEATDAVLEVTWPNGRRQRLRGVPADRRLTLGRNADRR